MNEPTRDEWISAYLDGEVGPEQRAEIERWLREDPEARRLYEELKAVGASLRSLPRESLGNDFPDRVLAHAEREMLLAPRSSPATGPSPDGAEVHDPARQTAPWRRAQRPLIYMLVTLAAGVLVMVWGNQQREPQATRQLARHREPPASPRAAPQRATRRDEPLVTELLARPSGPTAETADDARATFEKRAGRAASDRHSAAPDRSVEATARPSMSKAAAADRAAAPTAGNRSSSGESSIRLRGSAPAAKAAASPDNPRPAKASLPARATSPGKAAPKPKQPSVARPAMRPSLAAPESAALAEQQSAAPAEASSTRERRGRVAGATEPLAMPVVVVRWQKAPLDEARLTKLFAEADIRLTLLPEPASRGKRRRGAADRQVDRRRAVAETKPAPSEAPAEASPSEPPELPDAQRQPAAPAAEEHPAASGVQVIYVEATREQVERLVDALRDERTAELRILPDPHDEQQQRWARRLSGSESSSELSEQAGDVATEHDVTPAVDRQRLLQLARLWLAPARDLLRNAPADGAASPAGQIASASSHAWRLPVHLAPDELPVASDRTPATEQTDGTQAVQTAEQPRSAPIEQRRPGSNVADRPEPNAQKSGQAAAAQNTARQTSPAAPSVGPSSRSPALFVFIVDNASDRRPAAERPTTSAEATPSTSSDERADTPDEQ